MIMKNRLREKYEKEVIPAMRAKIGYPSVMAVPRIEKVTVNIGAGRISVEPGRVTVRAECADGTRFERAFDVAEGEVVNVEILLE